MKRRILKKKSVPAGLNVFQMDVKSLELHPDNVRVHDERNIQAIMSSLQEYGQQKPIVVDASNQVLAGNGTLEAIRRLGWRQVAVVRSSLSAIKAMGFMVADNKTTDLSDFDYSKLAEVMTSLSAKEFNLDATGFAEYERVPLLESHEFRAGDESLDAKGSSHSISFSSEEWDLLMSFHETKRKLKEAILSHVQSHSSVHGRRVPNRKKKAVLRPHKST